MKKLIFIFFILIHSLALKSISIEKPAYNSYVYDYAEVLTTEQSDALQRLLYLVDSATTNQVVLITVNDLQGESIENVTQEIGDTWGIGIEGQDNGIIIFSSLNDRQIRIEVGYGLEHIITDYWSSQHIREDVVPFFISEEYFKGFYTLTQNLIQELDPSFNFPDISENLGVEKKFPIHISEKPIPFNKFIDSASLTDEIKKSELESYLENIESDYGIPIYFYLFKDSTITQDFIFEYAYLIKDKWDFPYTYDDGRESYEDGILVIYNVANNTASSIVGLSYDYYLSSTYRILDSCLLNPNTSFDVRIKKTADTFAKTYQDEWWYMFYIIAGTILGLIIISIIAIKFGGGSNDSSYSDSYDNYSSSSYSSSSSSSSNTGTFGGGSFGGGGATGSW